MPPAWYPDPGRPDLLRWWDGYSWTAHVAPAQRFYSPPAPDPTRDLTSERKAVRLTSIALLISVPLLAAQYLVGAVAVHSIADSVRRFASTDGGFDNPDQEFHLSTHDRLLLLGGEAVSALALVVQILFVVWLFRSATLATRLGLPARHATEWAVLGVFLPIINYWFPYQVARDLFPPEHPGRRRVRAWWALWISLNVLGIAVVLASIFSLAAGLAIASGTVVVMLFTVVTAGRMMAEIVDCHATLVSRYGQQLPHLS
jgi:hypothetical protein